MLRIEPDAAGTTFRLMGRVQVSHIVELQKYIEARGRTIVFDLAEVTLVDLDVVRFLSACEESGVELRHCSRYIREWIRRESG